MKNFSFKKKFMLACILGLFMTVFLPFAAIASEIDLPEGFKIIEPSEVIMISPDNDANAHYVQPRDSVIAVSANELDRNNDGVKDAIAFYVLNVGTPIPKVCQSRYRL